MIFIFLTTGKRIILPSTFNGSPRHMNKLFQNAMALIRKFGKPDLFITFTFIKILLVSS